MSSRRVLFVTRRFWPLVGEAEGAIADLATGLKRRGHRPMILTARWRSDWPELFYFENVPVVRIAKPASGWWGDWAYSRRIAKWLRRSIADIDVVFMLADDRDETSILNVLRDTPVASIVLAGPANELTTREDAAGAYVADAPSLDDPIQNSDDRVCVIPPGVRVGPLASTQQRAAARSALAKACGDPRLNPLSPLAVYVGPLERQQNLAVVIRAWQQVTRGRPDARLWLFGEGPERGPLYDQIEVLKLYHRVGMPGLIEDTEDLLATADVYVAPGREVHLSTNLLAAMAAGLPVVASDTPVHRRIIAGNQHGLLFDPDEPGQCAQAIERVLAQADLAKSLGTNARQHVAENFSLESRLSRLEELMERLIAEKARH